MFCVGAGFKPAYMDVGHAGLAWSTDRPAFPVLKKAGYKPAPTRAGKTALDTFVLRVNSSLSTTQAVTGDMCTLVSLLGPRSCSNLAGKSASETTELMSIFGSAWPASITSAT